MRDGDICFLKAHLMAWKWWLHQYMLLIGQVQFLDSVLQELCSFQEGHLILGGDFNFVMDRSMDKSHFHKSTKASSSHKTALYELLVKYKLVDAWRLKKITVKDYTYYSGCHKCYTCIDYIMISQSLVFSLLKAEIGSIVGSDHSPVYCCFKSFKEREKCFSWILNKSLLFNDRAWQQIQVAIQDYFDTNKVDETSPPIWWDAFKCVLRGQLISLASHLKKEKEHKKWWLLEQIQTLEKKNKETSKKQIYKALLNHHRLSDDIEASQIQRNLLALKQKTWQTGLTFLRILAWRVKQRKLGRTISSIKTNRKFRSCIIGMGHLKGFQQCRELLSYFGTVYYGLQPFVCSCC